VSVRQRAGVVDYPANQLASLGVAARLRRWVMITGVRAVLEFADPVAATAMWPSRCLYSARSDARSQSRLPKCYPRRPARRPMPCRSSTPISVGRAITIKPGKETAVARLTRRSNNCTNSGSSAWHKQLAN
jgi:hypothetical protein